MKNIVVAGTGTRALNFVNGVFNRNYPNAKIVALYDINHKRMKGFQKLTHTNIPEFTDFDKMLNEAKPNTLLICTPDFTHPELVELGFANGLEVITEKPMAMNQEGIDRILAAEKKYNKKVVVTFNMRFAPYSAKIKEIMLTKPIGKITNVTAEWFIDYTHGIEYFHRWHGQMKNSGGLLVHKATHHFDLLNWFLDDIPASVFATGSRQVYGDKNSYRGSNCRNCKHTEHCWAAMKAVFNDADLNPNGDREIFNELFFQAENIDGYMRDGCCFDKNIDIYDTMNAIISYKNGTQLNYTCNAYSPWQGYNIIFNGTAGRIEVGTVAGATRPEGFPTDDCIRIIHGTTRDNITMETINLQEDKTPHGGGDNALFDYLFGDDRLDPLGQHATSKDGALSALIGITANKSIQSEQVEKIYY